MDDQVREEIQRHIDDGLELLPEHVDELHAETDENIDEDAYQQWMKSRGEGR